MTQVCVFPGHSSVRWSASGLRRPPARAYELCPRIGLLRDGKTRPRNWTQLTWTSGSCIWQLWYSLQNAFRLNRKRIYTRPEVMAKVRVYKTTKPHRDDHKIEKRFELWSNTQRHSRPRRCANLKIRQKSVTSVTHFRHKPLSLYKD